MNILSHIFKKKTSKVIIHTINLYHIFYFEIEKILATANLPHSLENDKQILTDKMNRLKNIGFTNTKEMIKAREQMETIKQKEDENTKNKNLIAAINYFRLKYPHYTFITQDSVDKICEKYGLFSHLISNYAGEVPEELLQSIENIKIDKEDECYYSYNGSEAVSYTYYKRYCNCSYYTLCPLVIVAKPSDFDWKVTLGLNLESSVKELKFCVVLKPVFFEGKKYYLAVIFFDFD